MVSKELIALAKCLKELGVETFEKLENRVSFQKKIYLLQVCGVNLGYMFGWDKYGPYSRELARNAGIYIEKQEDVDSRMNEFHFKQALTAGIEKTKKLISVPAELKDIPEVDFVELLSALHFLATDGGDQKYLPADADEEEIEKVNELALGIKTHLKCYEKHLKKIWEHLYKFFPQSEPHSQKHVVMQTISV